jgi:cardiolipin synthase
MQARHIPNIITTLRILLVYPTITCLLAGRYGAALFLFALAGVSDGLDGFLARYFDWRSRLGSYLDPLADKLLLVSCFLALSYLGLAPTWLTAVVIARDVIILAGGIAYWFLRKPFEGRPHWTSKANTFFQLLLIFAILSHEGFGLPSSAWPNFLIFVVLFTSLVSGVCYVYLWGMDYWRGRVGGSGF